MRAFTAVLNPGTRGGLAAVTAVVAQLRAAGAAVSVEPSRDMPHAAGLARDAAGRGAVVVAVGGDGMVGCLGGAVAAAGGVLGIVPAGRGNDFARALGLPGGVDATARALLHGPERVVDVLEAGGRIVLGSVYAGIDAVANGYANRSRLPRSLVYQAAALRALLGWRAASYRLVVDGVAEQVRGYTAVVANAGFYGNGLHIAPDATLDDGLLDIVLVAELAKPRFALATLRDLPRGTHVRLPQVRMYRGREVRIDADRPLPAFGDGEPLAPLPVQVRVRPAALRVIASA